MKPTTKNRWLKILAWLMVIVIIVMLIIPSDLTDEQLKQIKPGMTINDVIELLGEPIEAKKSGALAHYANHAPMWITYWQYQGKYWRPSIKINITNDKIPPFWTSGPNSSFEWISKHHLLWVQHHDGIVTRTWLFPITRTGGGLQGCIDTIKQYWNDWRK